MPADEKQFCSLIDSFRDRYSRATGNDIQEENVAVERNTALQGFSPQGWIGKTGRIDTTFSGATLEIELDCDATIKTWNNSLSDVKDETNIKKGTPLYSAVSTLSSGHLVRFSAQFLTDEKGHLREASLTRSGSMRSPDLIVKFLDVRPLE